MMEDFWFDELELDDMEQYEIDCLREDARLDHEDAMANRGKVIIDEDF